jgi:VanZ family protein
MRQPRVARALLLIAIAFIVYASVYPVELRHVRGDFLTVLLATWRVRMHTVLPGDIVANFVSYTPLGFLTFFSFGIALRSATRIAIATCFGIALSVGMETVQLFEVGRVSSFIDVITNTAGALFGAGIAARLNRHPDLLRRPASLLLLVTWVAATALLVVDANAHVTAVATTPFLIGAAAAVLLFLESLGRTVPLRVMATILLIGLAWRELEPFTFSTQRHTFYLVPFATLVAASRGAGILVFLDKFYFYGATIWFCRGFARPLPAATLLIAGMLAVLEAVQMYIPGRIPESTDAVLALIAGFVLYLLNVSADKNFNQS